MANKMWSMVLRWHQELFFIAVWNENFNCKVVWDSISPCLSLARNIKKIDVTIFELSCITTKKGRPGFHTEQQQKQRKQNSTRMKTITSNQPALKDTNLPIFVNLLIFHRMHGESFSKWNTWINLAHKRIGSFCEQVQSDIPTKTTISGVIQVKLMGKWVRTHHLPSIFKDTKTTHRYLVMQGTKAGFKWLSKN